MDQEIEVILDFIQYLNTIQNIIQPTIGDLITFDHTAYQTAKQIFNENITDISQESSQLRNKTFQLMKVLQYKQQPIESSVTSSYQCHSKENVNKNHKNPQEVISQKGQLNKLIKQTQIKNKKYAQTKIKQQVIISLPAKLKAKKKDKQIIVRDQNFDNSNFHRQSRGQLKQCQRNRCISTKDEAKVKLYDEFIYKDTQHENSNVKIAELKKLQYRRQAPLWAEENQKQYPQLQKNCRDNKDHFCRGNQLYAQKNINYCQGDCLYVRHGCYCYQNNNWHVLSNQRCSTRCETMEKIVNQFQLRSPQENDSIYSKQVLGMQGEKLRKSYNYRNHSRDQMSTSKSKYQKQKTETFITEHNEQQPRKSYFMTQDEPILIRDLRSTNTSKNCMKLKDYHSYQQQIQIKADQLASQSSKAQQIIFKKRLDNIMEDESEMMTSRQKIEEQQRKVRQLLKQREREQKKRQQDLLRKLKEQFSEINLKQPTEDEIKVSEEIKQLEIKLGKMTINNQREKSFRFNEDCTPKAKVVKLDISPNRNNGYKVIHYSQKNQYVMPRSSSISNKSSFKLMSRKNN